MILSLNRIIFMKRMDIYLKLCFIYDILIYIEGKERSPQ